LELTESLQGGAHLQSYMLLARGRAVVQDLAHFVQTMRISHSKWLLIQMGRSAWRDGCASGGIGSPPCLAMND